MTSTSPIELSELYSTLRQRVNVHIPNCCDEITLRLPHKLDGELAFYRLVNWAYALVNEAARIPLPYLANLPPLRVNDIHKREIVFLRTYLNHNLGNSKRDNRTAVGASSWFREACGKGSPRDPKHYAAACNELAKKLRKLLEGAIDACDLLEDPIDGSAIAKDLCLRVSQNWSADRFDPIVQQCAEEIGNPGIDLIKFRNKNLGTWRAVVKTAQRESSELAVRRKIEADLLSEIDATLPISAREAKKKICLSGKESIAVAMLLLREARSSASISIPELLHYLGGTQEIS